MKPGDRFGRLTIIACGEGRKTDSGDWTGALAICGCICGRVVEVRAVELRRVTSPRRSCGGSHQCRQCGEWVLGKADFWHRRQHVRAA